MTDGVVTRLGIRHHGPGSARIMLSALEILRPDIILIEGPSDGQELLQHVSEEGMTPPLALLLHEVADKTSSRRTAVFPFASWSPEWQAILYAHGVDVPARFIDLPQRIVQALPTDEASAGIGNTKDSIFRISDPLQELASAAGYACGEQWWDQLIEQQTHDDPVELFATVQDAMAAVRADQPTDTLTGLREAHMRQEIRLAKKEGHKQIIVVCGAWHAPALNIEAHKATSDRAMLTGLGRVKLRATWVPWSDERLTFASGYGAGIRSPRWYRHLWQTADDQSEAWLVEIAKRLREEGLIASSAQVIDAIQLAELLANMSGYARPTLTELVDAAIATFCHGNPTKFQLIERELLVGNRFGQVSAQVPDVPLQTDFESRVRRFRLRRSGSEATLKLDLRQPIHLQKSQLLHQLTLLNINWGRRLDTSGSQGTFTELWQLKWEPEHMITLVESSIWGQSVPEAAANRAVDLANQTEDLSSVAELMLLVIPAALTEAIASIASRLHSVVALEGSISDLMNALPPLASIEVYGDVRQSNDTKLIRPIIAAIIPRVCIGLNKSLHGLAYEGSLTTLPIIDRFQRAIRILSNDEWQAQWLSTLKSVSESTTINSLIRGLAIRLLFDSSYINETEVRRQFSLLSSHVVEAEEVSNWLEGFLRGNGLVLIHHPDLLELIDTWISSMDEELFLRQLPLLRKTFHQFEVAVRRQLGEQLFRQASGSKGPTEEWLPKIDLERAQRIAPTIARLLGINDMENPDG